MAMATTETVTPQQPSQTVTAQVYDHDTATPQQSSQTDVTAAQEVDDHDRKSSLAISRSNRVGLFANLILLLGYIFALWFQIYEFNGRDRETIAIVVYFLAFALLILSGIVELSVDVFSVRTIGHGRYRSDSARWNRAISSLFIMAGILDIAAFVYWMRREMEVEDKVLLVSSYILLIMAILALYFQLLEIKLQSWQETVLSDKFDLVANGLVFIVTVVGVVLRHMEYSQKDFGESTNRMELATVILWLFSSELFVATDLLRLQE
mmetsp:Transcript_17488/g.37812  ORF Transcript_17488/g.37812 Transcript_17488/m.37812 type:complete len:265 (+) Transcript_17488:176-970(+)|eukprot:CAMPEP_0172311974 /NCGR_PEP_ID=MMETSP1058-20130122/16258_1 /TAXON_ID=83371 /ORGANISM="Detonula confervacea, Strain CCMP 353" /LENGTH=264 /DNA_ID=CAMNT_0013025303 /DNA_START=171 /DNA_END=965 /DNA_ORIENTATION=+